MFSVQEGTGFEMVQFSTTGNFLRTVAVNGSTGIYDLNNGDIVGEEVRVTNDLYFTGNILKDANFVFLTTARKAVVNGNTISIEVCWSHEASLYLCAAASGNFELVKKYLEQGFSENMCYKVMHLCEVLNLAPSLQSKSIHMYIQDGPTPLILASVTAYVMCFKENLRVLKLLAENGAYVDAMTKV